MSKCDTHTAKDDAFENEMRHVEQEIERREKLLPKFQGSLIGGAAGDALGYAVEFLSDADIRSKYGTKGITEYDLDSQGIARFSDDTQMTLFTANGLLIGDTRGRLRGIGGPYAFYCGNTYRDWLHTQDPHSENYPDVSWLLSIKELYSRRAPGDTCLRACMEGLGSIDNPINNSKGCGGVMRVAPIGLYWANRLSDEKEKLLDFVVQEAAECAALTHGHPLGYISAGAFAYIVCRVTSEIPEDSAHRCRSLENIIDDCCRNLPRWFHDRPHAAKYQAELLQRACELAKCPEWSCLNIAKIGEGWVGEEALAIGVYACMRHTDDFGSAIRVAVNHDGDSDSTGSICGNIMGAMLGLGAIDEKWIEQLELHDLILEVAKDLCDGCQMSDYGSYWDDDWMQKYGGSCGSVLINDYLRGNVRRS